MDTESLKLAVLKEMNLVIRSTEPDKKKTLTVGDVIGYIDTAIGNVIKAEKLKSKS